MALDDPADQELVLGDDGTVLFHSPTAYINATLQSNSLLVNLGNWTLDAQFSVSQNVTHYLGLIFPQPRNITAFSMSYTGNGGSALPGNIAVSTDAVNLYDGTWVDQVTGTNITRWASASANVMRQPIAIDWPSTKALRFTIFGGASAGNSLQLHDFHLWGNYTRPGLAFWHDTLDQVMSGANLDFGDVGQGSIYTRSFRIKNNSAQTANNVTITAPAGGIGEVLKGLEFSDGGAYAQSIIVSSINPGAISSVITVRRTVEAAAALVPGCAKVTATAGSWT